MYKRQLREREEKYRNLFEYLPNYLVVLGLDGKIIDLNYAAAKFSPLSREDTVGMYFTDLQSITGEDSSFYQEMFSKFLEGEEIGVFESSLISRDGEVRLMEVHPAPLYKNNELYAIQIIAQDITCLLYTSNLADLRKEIHLSSSTILHGMNQLEQKNFIFRESGNYSLSQTGEVVSNKLIDVMRSFYSLNLCEGLFLNHDISCIPPDLFKDIGCLEKSFIVKSTSTNIMRPQEVLSEFLAKSKNFKQLTSVYNPASVQIFMKALENGGDVQLIMTEGIIDKLVETAGEELSLIHI